MKQTQQSAKQAKLTHKKKKIGSNSPLMEFIVVTERGAA